MFCKPSFVLLFSIFVTLFSIIVYTIFYKTDPPSPVIQLKDGKIQGIILKSRSGREFYGFIGIPFAEPPLGSLRFEPPVPAQPWEGIWDASFHRPLCPQLDAFLSTFKLGSEDCLYLNVYSPKPIPTDKNKTFPIMAYIHGGYFQLGGSIFIGPKYVMDYDVILVVLSYRLGALGFLNTGDGVARGNMGLKDQRLALQWIQRNIGAFGGDSGKVTLIGESAGAASIQFHQLSNHSQGLFSRVIRQSGSALNYWALSRNSKTQAANFAQKFACPVGTSEAMVECLRNKDVNTLLEGYSDTRDQLTPLVERFGPSIESVPDEDAFITEEPLDLLKSGRFTKNFTVLSGFCADEGLLYSTVLWANHTKLDEVDDWFSWASKALHYPPERKDISQKIRDFYFGREAKHLNSRDYIQNLTNLYGDRLFSLGILESAVLEKLGGVPSYLYLYGHEGGYNIGSLMMATQSSIHPIVGLILERLRYLYVAVVLGQVYRHQVPGVAHSDEFPLIWEGGYLYETEKDVELSKHLVKLWVDFAYGRVPLKFQNVDFTPSKKNESLKFLHIKLDNPEMIDEPYKSRREFWETLGILENQR